LYMATARALRLFITVFPQSLSYGRRERPALRRRADEVPFVAGDVEKHGDVAVGFGARCGEEPHARSCHPCVRGLGRAGGPGRPPSRFHIVPVRSAGARLPDRSAAGERLDLAALALDVTAVPDAGDTGGIPALRDPPRRD